MSELRDLYAGLAMHALLCDKQTNIYWIADYQDLWSLNHNSAKYSNSEYVDLEKNLIKYADAVITGRK